MRFMTPPLPAALLLLAAMGCDRSHRIAPAELAKGQHLARPFTAPAPCFGKPSQCVSDGQCAPPLSICQEGTCCSGDLDPVTCECRCGGGPACGSGELCCAPPPDAQPRSVEGQKNQPDQEIRCRPLRECFGEG